MDAVSTQTAEVYEDFTLSWQHTIGCERSRMLVVGVAVEDGNAVDVPVSSVTYNGVAMTKAASAVTVTTFEMNVESGTCSRPICRMRGIDYPVDVRHARATDNQNVVTVPFPIAGTWVSQHQMLGTWRVEVYHNEAKTPSVNGSFTLTE